MCSFNTAYNMRSLNVAIPEDFKLIIWETHVFDTENA